MHVISFNWLRAQILFNAILFARFFNPLVISIIVRRDKAATKSVNRVARSLWSAILAYCKKPVYFLYLCEKAHFLRDGITIVNFFFKRIM